MKNCDHKQGNKNNILVFCAVLGVFFFGFFLGALRKQDKDTNLNTQTHTHNQTQLIVPQNPETDSSFVKTYELAGRILERWKKIGPPLDRTWQYQAHESTLNVGHFFLEHFPNLYHFGDHLERFCYKDGMADSVKDLLRKMFPHIQFEQSEKCDETNSPLYSCFMSWSCSKNRQHLILSKSEIWQSYEALFKFCDISSVREEYDVLLMNRTGKENRRVLSYDKVIPYLNNRNLKYQTLESSQIKNMDQCQVFRAYAKARLVILPYGADILYPLLLSKKIISLVHKITSEGFWDTSRHQLARFAPFKVLSVEGKTSQKFSNSVGYNYYSSNVYHGNDLDMSTENLNDLQDIIEAMLNK